MYGKENSIDDLLEFLLEQFTLEELLEMNDLTEIEVLKVLFTEGLLVQPERVLQQEE